MAVSRFSLRAAALALGLAILSGSTPLLAQQAYTIRGRVVEATSLQPLPSATVILVGTQVGAATDNQGQFTLRGTFAPGAHQLQVTHLGHARVVRSITLGTDLDVDVGTIPMQTNAIQLNEVVVTGTGAPTERRKLGSTITSVPGEEINSAPATQSVDKALQGRVIGAVISQNNGQPGGGVSIRLRGTGSILGGAEPLIVVDGVIVENNSDALVSLGANASRGALRSRNSLVRHRARRHRSRGSGEGRCRRCAVRLARQQRRHPDLHQARERGHAERDLPHRAPHRLHAKAVLAQRVSHRRTRRRAVRWRLGDGRAGDSVRLPGPDLPAVQRRHEPALRERRQRGHEVLRVGAVADADGDRARHGHEQRQRPHARSRRR